ncbi:MAG: hypothetical protein M3132_12160 [Actinomycetia bacterium]|nr:hypothetical protein [Actinomycetes bacterium]
MRRILTLLLIVVGLALMVIGYLSSAPWGATSVADSNPAFVGAPSLFLIGVVTLLLSALVYELLPSRDDDRVE